MVRHRPLSSIFNKGDLIRNDGKGFFIIEPVIEEQDPSSNNITNTNTNTRDHHSSFIFSKHTILQLIFLSLFSGWMIGAGILSTNLSPFNNAFQVKVLTPLLNSVHRGKKGKVEKEEEEEEPWIVGDRKQLLSFKLGRTNWRVKLASRIRNSILYETIGNFRNNSHLVWRFFFHSQNMSTVESTPFLIRGLKLLWPWADWSTYDSLDRLYRDYESPLSSKRYASTFANSHTFTSLLTQMLLGYTHRHMSATKRRSLFSRKWVTLRDSGASHPLSFALLKEMIQRESGGYVHPDLGLLLPAPSGAGRGLGMVRDSFTNCQRRCFPGIASEKLQIKHTQGHIFDDTTNTIPFSNETHILHRPSHVRRTMVHHQQSIPPIYQQEEVLLKIPLATQMTRTVALHVLSPLLPDDILHRAPLLELDDAILLTLHLAHEAMKGKTSIYWPYILTLPMQPSCAFGNGAVFNAMAVLSGGGAEPGMTPQDNIWASLQSMGTTLGMDTQGWFEETLKAADYVETICENLARHYGPHIAVSSSSIQRQYHEELLAGMMREVGKKIHPHSTIQTQRDTGKAYLYIQWALCHVASRAIAASPKHGALRLVPLMDLINHNVDGGNFVEITGTESLEEGDVVDAEEEEESGMFIVRSLRLGRRKPLKSGQELLVNYNVPQYSPLDWFLNMGFVPPERSERWELMEPILSKIHHTHRDRPSSSTDGIGANPPIHHMLQVSDVGIKTFDDSFQL